MSRFSYLLGLAILESGWHLVTASLVLPHFKSNEISYAHVESFWQFIESNLSKFMVNGGKSALLEKIKISFNITFTRPGHDFSEIINNIPLVVERHEMVDFFKEIDKIFTGLHWLYPVDDHDEEELIDMIKFWGAILDSPELQEYAVDYLKTDYALFAATISFKPQRLSFFVGDTVFLGIFWKKELKKVDYLTHYGDLLLSFLTVGLISLDEREEFFYGALRNSS